MLTIIYKCALYAVRACVFVRTAPLLASCFSTRQRTEDTAGINQQKNKQSVGELFFVFVPWFLGQVRTHKKTCFVLTCGAVCLCILCTCMYYYMCASSFLWLDTAH